MRKYNWEGLTPLFYSEISSSYMLYDIFKKNKTIASELIKKNFKIDAKIQYIKREYSYNKKGSVDIYINFISEGKICELLIEVKVHDYLSATEGQISTYYNAAIEGNKDKQVYFIYITQFTKKDNFEGIILPKTIDEARKGESLIKQNFAHISWKHMHIFLENYYKFMTDEQKLIVSLNRQWITEKCERDLEDKRIDIGERGIENYFSDVNINIQNNLSFGRIISKNNRQIWTIDLSELEEKQLDLVLEVIKSFSQSKSVNKIRKYKTEEATIEAARKFLEKMLLNTDEWQLVGFYSRLFALVENTTYLKFNGTGTRGFSIKLGIENIGEISLCTIFNNKTIEFSLKR
ncbi:PD-(D/E)XK nuclease family protein [Paraclostridium sordellii]|uniref:PD-(D/E)XK nuclease family protein n=1 Tax=Paraclostridium sordellii TaxID=1505 RepID=UPI0005DCE848|nr:PD-(D/E)XK nuclease family protein [Paeniclostridium sordellii]MCQ4696778.1 PD-(D/E)XK nuclease family protein [Paeniclostridium sordellii]CEO24185.1 Uncharacterised protein [[Clostridium] sordellii] [Paeniclostridium sordellii]